MKGMEGKGMTRNGHRLTQKQETFTVHYFQNGNATEAALVAKYGAKSARSKGSQLLANVNIQARLAELRQKAEDDSVATVLERKQVLTEIVRGRFADFMQKPSAEQLRSAALQEVKVVDVAGGKSTTIRLHDPTKAVDLLNKMDKLYAEGASVLVDNRQVHVHVDSEKGKELTQALVAGEGTGEDQDD